MCEMCIIVVTDSVVQEQVHYVNYTETLAECNLQSIVQVFEQPQVWKIMKTQKTKQLEEECNLRQIRKISFSFLCLRMNCEDCDAV